jgi:hypothetical protein
MSLSSDSITNNKVFFQTERKSRPLSEYTWIVEAIRQNRQQMPLDEAVDMALNNMPSDFIIKPWLEVNRKVVRNMLLTEYNEEETMELFKEE